MAGTTKILCVVFFVALMAQGTLQQCVVSDIEITQKATGKNVKNKPEWNATVSSNCPCVQSNVQLSCKGFETVEPVDPLLLSKSGDLCLLNNGVRIYGENAISFVYAADAPYPFKPVSSTVNCS